MKNSPVNSMLDRFWDEVDLSPKEVRDWHDLIQQTLRLKVGLSAGYYPDYLLPDLAELASKRTNYRSQIATWLEHVTAKPALSGLGCDLLNRLRADPWVLLGCSLPELDRFERITAERVNTARQPEWDLDNEEEEGV